LLFPPSSLAAAQSSGALLTDERSPTIASIDTFPSSELTHRVNPDSHELTPPMSSVLAAPVASDAIAKPYRVGTLSYNKRDLFWLFAWLLAGDFVFIILNQLEPRVLPVLLQQFQASDKQIALIVGSIPALMNLAVSPIVSYRSDRKRSRWGRRIPYLVWAAPFAALFLAATPFAPELARTFRVPALHMFGESWGPTLVMLAAICIGFQGFQYIISSIYFYLFRDTVPALFMGRFLALMRIFSALGIFVLNYWLIGLADTHAKEIFIGVAALTLIGFWAMCYAVREGEYPEPTPPPTAAPLQNKRFRAIHEFMRESFCDPVYWWSYGARLLVYASMPLLGFTLLFAHQELHLEFDVAGKVLAIPAMAWLLFAYPAGLWIERRGAAAVLIASAAFSALLYAWSFIGVVGIKTFILSALLTGLGYWLVMLAQIALAQEIFPAARMGQFSSANAMLQSIVIAVITTPATGWLLESLKGIELSWELPWGTVEIGSYRFSYLILAVIYAGSWLCTLRARHWWRVHGGPKNYIAPLPPAL
jgi:maltose/moltooligosaccharide transporter